MKKTFNGRHLICVVLPDQSTRQVYTNEFRRRVWETLETVNHKFSRAAAVAEVLAAGEKAFEKFFLDSKKRKDAVTKALNFFVARELAFTVKKDERRVYGSPKILDPHAVHTLEPREPSLRRRVLLLVYQTIERCGNHAVRCRDVIEYADQMKIENLSEKQIVHNIWGLKRTGELKIAGQIYGNQFGRTVFLPAEINLSEVNARKAATLADTVADAFKEIWEERIKEAEAKNQLIRPVLTSEILERIEQSDEARVFIEKSREITHVLKNLSNPTNALVRFIEQSNGMKLWMAADVENSRIDLANTYSTNTLKITEAVERAYVRVGDCPVTLKEIKKEIQTDKSLMLSSKISLAQHLSILSNRKNQIEKLKRNGAFTEFIVHAGSDGKHSYFAPFGSSVKRNASLIEAYKITNNWNKLKEIESWNSIENCRINFVRIGRLMLLHQSASEFLEKLRENKVENLASEFKMLIEKLEAAKEQAGKLILSEREISNFPVAVEQKTKGLTSKEAAEFLAPFYPVAARLWNHENKYCARISSVIRKGFRQIDNPEFKNKKSKLSCHSSRFLFEYTDTLIRTALKWGGSECRFQALIAEQELGTLRDAGFVLPALESTDFEQRQIAVACIAFLQTYSDAIKELAVSDPVAEIRQAALWAFAFMRAENWRILACKISKQDSDPLVRKFAEQIARFDSETEIWQM